MQKKLNVSDEKIVELKVKIADLKLEKEKEWLSISTKILLSIIGFSLTLTFVWDSLKKSAVDTGVLLVTYINKLPWPNLALILTLIILVAIPLLVAYLGGRLGGKLVGAYEQEHRKIYDEEINELENIVNECQK